MKVQNIRSLGFGKKPDYHNGDENPSIMAPTVLGSAAGTVGGIVARNYTPVSDEFFHKVDKNDIEDKVKVSNAVNNFIEKYAAADIESARVLKTVLVSEASSSASPFKGEAISALINESSIKVVGENDTEELRNAVKSLNSDFRTDMKTGSNLLPQKVEAVESLASENLSLARKGIFVKENLKDCRDSLKGLSDNGRGNIRSVKKHIKGLQSGTSEMREELSLAFSEMIKVAKKSQRSIEGWVILPAVASGLFGMFWAISKQDKRIEV